MISGNHRYSHISRYVWPALAGVVFLAVAACGQSTASQRQAQRTDPSPTVQLTQLRNLKVVGHQWTTRIGGLPHRTVSVINAAKTRFLILRMSATIDRAQSPVFGPDFVLAYRHADGRENRASVVGLAEIIPNRSPDIQPFNLGRDGGIKLGPGKVHFVLAFLVHSDVETVDLYRVGMQPIVYRIGHERPYSIAIVTNSDPSLLAKVKAMAEQKGFEAVYTSDKLNAKATGVTVHYAPDAKAAATEFGELLKSRLGLQPKLQATRLRGEVDVCVWLGK